VITTGSFSYPETDALQRAEGKRIVEQDLMREAALAIVERIRAVVPA
jgi:outer membrane lipopolysaccharide assembly protein LptE/RlpB